MTMNFKNKRILLGLTGGIAIYKSASLLRKLVHHYQADVQVVMTKSATEFMSPLIFETFSGKPVITDMFSGEAVGTRHIDLAKDSDLVLVCPATANMIAKSANGIADDMLSTVILAAGKKTIFAPAMNVNMWENEATQANVKILKERGYRFIDPESGELACQDVGTGRLATEKYILGYIDAYLSGRDSLKGKKVIITAGPTREYMDPVRFISNRSTGKMGFALAEEAVKEKAEVLLISGPTNLDLPNGVEYVQIETAEEMKSILNENAGSVDYLFMAAAVEDFRPSINSDVKIKKSQKLDAIPIEMSPDLISDFTKHNQETCVVGFSVEMENGKERSLKKMEDKGLDFIVWNDPSKKGVGFAAETNEVTVFSKTGNEWFLEMKPKRKIAEEIIRVVVDQYSENA